MAKFCVYCGKSKKMSGEHLISAKVLKELYGEEIENTHHGKKGGEWKILQNYEGKIKDLCIGCNSHLSDLGYDVAGGVLAREVLDTFDGKPLVLTFTKETLGWLLKTHLNLVRDSIPSLPRNIVLDKELLGEIINGSAFNEKSFFLICQAIDMPSDIWEKVSSMNAQVGLVNEYDLVISQLRIRQLDTFMVFSTSDNERDISNLIDQALVAIFMTTANPEIKDINIQEGLNNGSITIERTVTPELFSTGLMTTNEYEDLFKK